MSDDTETLAEVLAAHQRSQMDGGRCICGAWPPAAHDVEWTRHLVEALEPVIAARIEQARAGEGALRERVEAHADWLADERDRIRAAYREHNAGRSGDRPRRRPDLDTWANAYEVAERHLRAALTNAGDDRGGLR